jgi:hypothetical protein
MGDGTAMVQWTAQWAASICHQCRSGAMGGDARWTAAAITVDGGGMSNGQWQRQWAMVAQWAMGWQSNPNGQSDGSGVMDGTMGGVQLPANEGTKMGAMLGFWLVSEL